MRALVFHKINDVSVENVEDPRIEDSRDAIVRVTSTAICGSDLHILDGFVPQMKDMVLGHEFMGIVEEVGPGVKNLKKGDRVVVPFPIACGQCYFCTHQWPTQCENSNPNYGPDGGFMTDKGAALFGYTDLYGGYQGGQAEYARVPFADYGPRVVPDGLTDEQVLFLTDIFPTGWAATDWGRVGGGETVAIFGAGPVGIMAAKSAWLRGAARVVHIDLQPSRLEQAKRSANSATIRSQD
ncbi:MAG: alcohol dehydrogenase catalytic domain-containing protein, partial [Hymenobacteraceae bacterium]|nr:alcohol dehydrogenase catalytic domain-containing protein [Hymenobacteraceae bacterium]